MHPCLLCAVGGIEGVRMSFGRHLKTLPNLIEPYLHPCRGGWRKEPAELTGMGAAGRGRPPPRPGLDEGAQLAYRGRGGVGCMVAHGEHGRMGGAWCWSNLPRQMLTRRETSWASGYGACPDVLLHPGANIPLGERVYRCMP